MSQTVPGTEFDASRLTLVERCLRVFTDIRPGEGRTGLMMFANVLLILCAYYFVKPLREGWLAVSTIEGLTKLELKAYSSFAQTVILVGVVVVYGRLVERWQRSVLITRVTLFCMVNMLIFWPLQPNFLFGPLPGVGIIFYLWVGMFGVFVVAQFWAFAADLYTEERGKRLLPMIAIGATSGAVVGAWLTNQLVGLGLVRTEYLLLVALVPLGASIVLMRSADRREGGRSDTSNRGRPKQQAGGAIPLVLGTRFLLVVAIITLILNWVNTNGENLLFQFVQDKLTGDLRAKGITSPDEILLRLREATTVFYGSFFLWVNLFALSMQALLASRLLKYGGFGAIFLMLPAIALVSYSAMLLIPLLAVVKWMKVAENSTDYSINNTARHVLWLPMSQEVTLKAKPTIDSLFVRAGDGLAALTVLLGVRVLTLPLKSYVVVNLVLVVIWLLGALWVVREHKTLSASQASKPVT